MCALVCLCACVLALQNFALGKGDEEVISTLQHFAKTVEEVRAVCVCVCMCVCVCESVRVSVYVSVCVCVCV